MIGLRRAGLIVLVSVALALVGGLLGRTPWAAGIRERAERYIREHPRPIRPTIQAAPPGVSNPPPRRRRTFGRYVTPFVAPVVLLIVAPAGLTFLILRQTRLRGRRPAAN